MKTIGLIGGTTWLSTVEYYRIINEEVNKVLGGFNYPRCILFSFSQGEIYDLIKNDEKEKLFKSLLDASKKIIDIGADCVLLCANTTHMVADQLEKEINVPLIHIGTETVKQIIKNKLSKVGLLGTKYTMEQDFMKTKFRDKGIEVIVPDAGDRNFIHKSILNELVKEVFKKDTKDEFLNIIKKLRSQGAEGIVLGCTEIPLLIKDGDTDLPLFNTFLIHSMAAVNFVLERD